jgi:hypothetical protein
MGKKYHTVGSIPKSNRKIVEIEASSILIAHLYMTTHFYG